MLLGGSTARAQTVEPFNLERLTLNPGAEDSLVVGTGRLLPEGHFQLLALASYERTPLLLRTSANPLGSIVADRLTMDLAFAYSVTDRLQLDLELPIIARQRGDDLSAEGVPALAGAGLGAPWIGARYGLLAQTRGAAINLAVDLGVGLPLGTEAGYARSAPVAVVPRVEASRAFTGWLFGLRAGVLLRGKSALPGGDVGSGLQLDAVAATTHPGIRGELTLRSAIAFTGAPVGLELLGGVRVPLGGGFEAHALGGPGLTRSPGTPSFRLLVGIGFGGGPAKAPPPPPDPCAANAPDRARKCPTLDFDHDGIANGVDACVEKPEDLDGFQDANGCPDPDNDADGVPDSTDRCPNVPGDAKDAGCETKKVAAIAEKLQVAKPVTLSNDEVRFGFDQVSITPSFAKRLDEVAAALRNHPAILQVEIQGHTDDVGTPAYNLALSQRRADAVRDYLVRKGIAPGRLVTRGYGESQPIADNHTAEGRAKNRRVTFIVVSRKGGQPSQH